MVAINSKQQLNYMSKLTKKEIKTFLNKDVVVFLTIPISLANSRSISELQRFVSRENSSYSSITFNFVFSKNATKNAFYHVFFEPSYYENNRWKDWMRDNSQIINTVASVLNKITIKNNNRKRK